MVAEAPVTLTAKWEIKAELQNFELTCTESEVVIRNVKDKQTETIIIPDYVTTIVKGAFNQCYRLTSLTMPFSDKYLGYYFGAHSYVNNDSYVPQSLKTLKITRGFFTAENFIFRCQMIDNVILPDTITSIGASSFKSTSFSHFTMPKQVVGIGNYAFSGNCNLLNISLPDSLTSIGNYAFSGCSRIEKLVIPYNVAQVGERILDAVGKTKIYCEVPQKPANWDLNWNYTQNNATRHDVVWNYQE